MQKHTNILRTFLLALLATSSVSAWISSSKQQTDTETNPFLSQQQRAEEQQKKLQEHLDAEFMSCRAAECIHNMLQKGANPNCGNGLNTQLVQAAQRGDIEAVTILINYGALAHPFIFHAMASAFTGDNSDVREILRLLIAKGLNINEQDSSGNTPLHIAAQNLNSSFIHVLIDFEADPSIKNSRDETPFEVWEKEEAELKNNHPSLYKFFTFKRTQWDAYQAAAPERKKRCVVSAKNIENAENTMPQYE